MKKKIVLNGLKKGFESLVFVETMKVPKTQTPRTRFAWLVFCSQVYCQGLVGMASTMLQDARSWGDVEEYATLVGYKDGKEIYRMLNLAIKIGTDMIKRLLTGKIMWAKPITDAEGNPDAKKAASMQRRYQPSNQLDWVMGMMAQIQKHIGNLYHIKNDKGTVWGPMCPVGRWNKAVWTQVPDIIEPDMSNWDETWPIERKKMALMPCYQGIVPIVARIVMPRIKEAWDAQRLVSRPATFYQGWVNPRNLPIALAQELVLHYTAWLGPAMENSRTRKVEFENGPDEEYEFWAMEMQQAFNEVVAVHGCTRRELAEAVWWVAHGGKATNATAPFILCPEETVEIIKRAKVEFEANKTAKHVIGIGFRYQWETIPRVVELPVEIRDEIVVNSKGTSERRMLLCSQVPIKELKTTKYPEGTIGMVSMAAGSDGVMAGHYFAKITESGKSSWEVTLFREKP